MYSVPLRLFSAPSANSVLNQPVAPPRYQPQAAFRLPPLLFPFSYSRHSPLTTRHFLPRHFPIQSPPPDTTPHVLESLLTRPPHTAQTARPPPRPYENCNMCSASDKTAPAHKFPASS